MTWETMSERILLIHWVTPHSECNTAAACGETSLVSYIDGKNKHYRHVYVTQSYDEVTCEECLRVLNLYILGNIEI